MPIVLCTDHVLDLGGYVNFLFLFFVGYADSATHAGVNSWRLFYRTMNFL